MIGIDKLLSGLTAAQLAWVKDKAEYEKVPGNEGALLAALAETGLGRARIAEAISSAMEEDPLEIWIFMHGEENHDRHFSVTVGEFGEFFTTPGVTALDLEQAFNKALSKASELGLSSDAIRINNQAKAKAEENGWGKH